MSFKKLSLLVLVILALSVVMVQAQDEEMADVVIEPVECSEPGNLTMWVWDENWQDIIGESIEVWKEEYCPGAEVELIQQPWGQYWDLLRTNAAGGDMPDVFNMSQTFVGFYFDNDALLNLQPYFDEAGIDASVWSPGFVGPYMREGDAYAAPVNWDTIAVFYNKAMLEAAGLDEPTADWTWDDFETYAEALTDEEAGVWGAVAYAEFQAGFGSFLSSTGEAPFMNAEGECTLTEPGNTAALNWLKDMYDAGYMPSISDMGGASADDAFNMFASEKVAMVTAGSWKLSDAISNIEFDWDIVRLPINPETGLSRSQTHAVGYMAAANTENPDLAANLIIFLGSDEGQQFFAEGGNVAPANPNPALQAMWAATFEESGKNVQAFIDATDDTQGVTMTADTFGLGNELTTLIFDLDMDVESATAEICAQVDEIMGN